MWEDNEVFLRFKGVTIYRVYKDDMGDIQREYWFHVSPAGSEHDEECFDVRDIPVPESVNRSDHKAVLRYAIRQGWLTAAGLEIPGDITARRLKEQRA
ncbi:MAG: hypothetical protein AB1411_15760 [Nitrospirota bacterium]